MLDDHPRFWLDLTGRIGPPIFAATLVGCLLQERLEASHIALMGIGLVLIVVSHWGLYHVHGRSGPDADG